MKQKIALCGAMSVAVVGMLIPQAQATLADLEAIQGANPNLAFQYGFEGSDDSTRLADGSVNGFGLQRTVGSAGGDVNDIQFVAGFDGSSQAYRPSFDLALRNVGAGLNTISTEVPITQTFTTEFVLQLDTFLQTPDSSTGGYILSARPQPNNQRAYFLRQFDTPNQRLATTMGDTFGDQLDVLVYNPGDWYYIAMVSSTDGTQTTVDFFGANLSLGETSLSPLASDNSLFQGDWSGNAQVGIGAFANGGQEYMQGNLDSVALTNELLSQSTLQSHLDALLIPEPSTLALAALGGLLVAVRCRRR